MRRTLMVAALAVVALSAACKKTGENEYQVQTPDVDVKTDSATIRTPDVDVGSKIDTVTTPVVGTKQTEIKTPTVEVKRP